MRLHPSNASARCNSPSRAGARFPDERIPAYFPLTGPVLRSELQILFLDPLQPVIYLTQQSWLSPFLPQSVNLSVKNRSVKEATKITVSHSLPLDNSARVLKGQTRA